MGKRSNGGNQMKQCFLLITLALVACTKDDDKPSFACGEEISLDQDIMPIINLNCATSLCHLDGQSPLLNTNEAVIANAANIRSEVEAMTMPPGGQVPLSAEEIELISCWVEDGALNN